MRYLKSFFSFKKIRFKDISWFSYWDDNSSFTEYTRLGRFVSLFESKVGKYTRISKGCVLEYANIGNFCSLANDVQVGVGRHPIRSASTSQLFFNLNSLTNKWVGPMNFSSNLPVHIANDVWIGSNSLIMGGISIGDGAIIGSHAVVTKDIPAYAIAVGVPARIVKYRFDENIIERLLEIKWWNFSDDEINEHIEFFRDPELTLEKINNYFPPS